MVSNSGRDFDRIRVVFYAMLAGQLIFTAIAFFLRTDFEPATLFGPQEDLLYLALYAGAMVIGARFIDKIRAKNAGQDLRRDEPRAMRSYRTTVIVRLAVIEAANFLIIVAGLITANQQLLLLALLVAVAFYLFRPTEEEFRERYFGG